MYNTKSNGPTMELWHDQQNQNKLISINRKPTATIQDLHQKPLFLTDWNICQRQDRNLYATSNFSNFDSNDQ